MVKGRFEVRLMASIFVVAGYAGHPYSSHVVDFLEYLWRPERHSTLAAAKAAPVAPRSNIYSKDVRHLPSPAPSKIEWRKKRKYWSSATSSSSFCKNGNEYRIPIKENRALRTFRLDLSNSKVQWKAIRVRSFRFWNLKSPTWVAKSRSKSIFGFSDNFLISLLVALFYFPFFFFANQMLHFSGWHHFCAMSSRQRALPISFHLTSEINHYLRLTGFRRPPSFHPIVFYNYGSFMTSIPSRLLATCDCASFWFTSADARAICRWFSFYGHHCFGTLRFYAYNSYVDANT